MKPSQAVSAIKTAVRAGRPVMLYGTPGIGKSDLVRQVCADLGYVVTDIRVSQLDPVDLRGVPIVNVTDLVTRWSKASWWPKEGVKTCLFWDEINSGALSTMAATYQIILDQSLGEHELPEGTIQLAAGNNLTDGGLTNVMPTPLKNRFIHIDVDVDDEEWCQWAVKHNIRTEIISLIRLKPTLLNEFGRVNRGEQSASDSAHDRRTKKAVSHKDLKAFATPRTWAFCSQLMEAQPEPTIAFALYAGTVGEGAATELVAHIEVNGKLPDFKLIFDNPERAPVPSADEPALMYSLATALAAKSTAENFPAVLIYAQRLPAEHSVMLVKDALMRDRKLASVKGFDVWARAHSGVVL